MKSTDTRTDGFGEPIDQMLAEAYDQHLVTEQKGGREFLLAHRQALARSDSDQALFQELLSEQLLQPCTRRLAGVENGQVIYAASIKGMQKLSDLALDFNSHPVMTEALWSENRFSLCWEQPHSIWESFQGQILCHVESGDGALLARDQLLADVDILRLNGAVCSTAGVSLVEAIGALPGLQDYSALPVCLDGEAETLEELCDILGLFDASSCNLILINYIKVKARFLGIGMGARILRKLLLGLAPGGGVAALSPHPLQFGMPGSTPASGESFAQAHRSLRRYYERLGFVEHPFSKELMVCDLQNKKLERIPAT